MFLYKHNRAVSIRLHSDVLQNQRRGENYQFAGGYLGNIKCLNNNEQKNLQYGRIVLRNINIDYEYASLSDIWMYIKMCFTVLG